MCSGWHKKPDGEFWPEMNAETAGWIFLTGSIGRKKQIHSCSSTIQLSMQYFSNIVNSRSLILVPPSRITNKDVRGSYRCRVLILVSVLETGEIGGIILLWAWSYGKLRGLAKESFSAARTAHNSRQSCESHHHSHSHPYKYHSHHWHCSQHISTIPLLLKKLPKCPNSSLFQQVWMDTF